MKRVLNKQQLIEMLYAAGEKASVSEIGNRADLEQAMFNEPELEREIVDFFNWFGWMYAEQVVNAK